MEPDTLTTRQRTEVSLHYNWPLRPEQSGAMMEEQSARICISLWAVHCLARHLAVEDTEITGLSQNPQMWFFPRRRPIRALRVLVALSRPSLDIILVCIVHVPPGPHSPWLMSDVWVFVLSPDPTAGQLHLQAGPAAGHLLSPLCSCIHPFHCW